MKVQLETELKEAARSGPQPCYFRCCTWDVMYVVSMYVVSMYVVSMYVVSMYVVSINIITGDAMGEIYRILSSCVAGVGVVSHTLGPLDGSLYATVTKKRQHQQPPPASPHTPASPHAFATHTPSPHAFANGRYAASIDSGIASSNSAGAAPVSPPTSDTSQTSGESRGTAAAVAAGRAAAGGAPPYVDARQLDELLQGMLLEIQSIPDLRPGQTPAPDIDSIRCPDFTKTESRTGAASRGEAGSHPYATHTTHVTHTHVTHSPVNGYSGSTTHDSLLDTSMSTTADDLPYHARTDSKPFSYGAVTSSPLLGRRRAASEGGDGAPPSPPIPRRNSRDALGQPRPGLESPRLVRRLSGSVGGSPGEGVGRRSPSPDAGSRSATLQRQRSQTLTTRLMSGVEAPPNSTLTRSEHSRSASRLDDDFDFDPHSRSFSSTSSNNVSWLQMQQRKLAERREAKFRAERGPQEARMLSELRTRMSQQQRTTTTTSKEIEDGYVSDNTLLSETSRESSPVKTFPPLTINTGVAPSTPQKPPIGHSTPARGNSAPSSPVLPTRSASREHSVRNNAPSNSQRSLPRKHPDMSERERPFVAVKRAHEHAKPSESVDSSLALSQLQTSPHGHINYSSYSSSSPVDGLLTTVVSSTNQEGLDSLDALSATLASLGSPTHPPTSTTSPPNPIRSSITTTTTTTTTAVTTSAGSQSIQTAQTSQSREDSAWQSDTESSFGGIRPITPGFPPATPTTPYLNQGLPPKSPTMQRRAHLGLSSLSSRPTVKKSASLPSKEMGIRSPSPATSQTLRQEVNGHSSPAPSLYHSQSRRSSLTSLNESTEVISSHPKFVKDISKFWYKPTITRDEGKSLFKDFVVLSIDSSLALSQLQTSPHGHINYSSYSSSSPVDGLLTTVVSSTNQEGLDSLDALSATLASLGSPTHPPTLYYLTAQPHTQQHHNYHHHHCCHHLCRVTIIQTAQTSQSREDSAWQSDTESSFGGIRPITPGFPPATPTTPYLNQGLPPKSPTMQRRAHLGLSSLSSRPTVKKSASLPSKEMGIRSPSPATSQTLRQEVNGHSSPAPSLYHSQSRRSSLTSLNESTEVISSHPKFVKDISKFWYKPTITRDEAITMLKDKAPGTFVVRDSNSFPGAFGLALKVSTPPPNVSAKSSDPASELVRHFLIEPTSRGVRLKGCANEPVFGSLSALVYQHSITALALPCRLMLPEKDPAGAADTVDSGASTSTGSSSTTQLLQQGAACNVMYLHTADTESLTGPQAVKRAVSLMLASKITPTVVHFKVSAQGITLTDNERKLFFRRHYPVNTISHCGLDPDDRRWAHKNEEGAPLGSLRVFGFVAKKGASRTENQCHILAELEPEQPATAICNFVTKVMMTSVSRPNLV
ncbi:tensin-1-like [Procambarus clarkii]|uniref:tensin-1-like n=1 Tax=Procambarus clarkii TaxID=6728 RepID=UPI0037445777